MFGIISCSLFHESFLPHLHICSRSRTRNQKLFHHEASAVTGHPWNILLAGYDITTPIYSTLHTDFRCQDMLDVHIGSGRGCISSSWMILGYHLPYNGLYPYFLAYRLPHIHISWLITCPIFIHISSYHAPYPFPGFTCPVPYFGLSPARYPYFLAYHLPYPYFLAFTCPTYFLANLPRIYFLVPRSIIPLSINFLAYHLRIHILAYHLPRIHIFWVKISCIIHIFF